MAIRTLDELRAHLQYAIEIEHATIPPYLTALYSIVPGANDEAAHVIMSVFIEEMLHMTLAANVLNAVGGAPSVDRPEFVPGYPVYLPHSRESFIVPLARFSPETIQTFMRIEYPALEEDDPEDDRYDTTGQFYRAIEDGLQLLVRELGEAAVFTGDPARQVTPEALYYRFGGRIIPVYDLESALLAIDEIEEQGEGLKRVEIWDGDRDMFHPERDEVAHYFRFNEVMQGRSYQRGDTPASGPTGATFDVDWQGAYPMRPNPRSADHAEGTPVRVAMDSFNQAYWDLLRMLQQSFNGNPALMLNALTPMAELRDSAQALMQMPTGDGETTAGPSFEYMPASEPEAALPYRIRIENGGPYLIEGGIPLVRKSIVYSEWGEPMTWRREDEIATPETYRLCRCGQSGHKPFCDGSHRRVGFEGTENPPPEPSAELQVRTEGTHMTLTDYRPICAQAGFCGNRFRHVWQMMGDTGDSQVRFEAMHRTELCPSGRLTYEVDGVPIEPDLPREIGVVKDGPYWVTGGLPITLSDGRTLGVRNRVTLCRCGQSNIKPLCDGSHEKVGFKEG